MKNENEPDTLVNCATCGRRNPAGARFCGGCGKPLARRCLACGCESEPDAQFCVACGASVARPADVAVARKVVTIVFADMIGSTSLHERLDAESARRLMDRYYRGLRSVVESHGGTVVKLLGDGVMAAFGVPRVSEDDAIRAVRAAVGMQHAFGEIVHQQTGMVGDIGLRVAVNTGEVVVSDDHADVVGDPVNVAARLQQEAHDGEVLIGESTRRLVSDLVTLVPFGDLTLKGRSETVAAYRVVSLERPAGATAVAFVGRDDELRRLIAVHDAAVRAGHARLAVILGSPGLGKSRLLDEFARRLGDEATVLTANCEAAGGATFAPLAKALRALLGVDEGSDVDGLRAALDVAVAGGDSERGRIAEGITALLAGTPAPPEETFFVVRRFLAGLTAVRPVVLVIDDVQWAEPLLLDLTEHLVQWSTDVPLFVLVAARPELRDARSSLVTPGGLVADVLTLGGLDAGAATRLAANVIGAGELPAAIAGRVLATSEGNPLFVGELVRMLVHDGALKREGDRWIAGTEIAALEMPPTIQALLAARIERLRPEERTVLERAAVVGRHFSRAAVAHLLPREMTDLDGRLESLRRSELIETGTGWFLGEPVLRFHHVLIRDAAYRRLLKGTRAELHSRVADWIESRVGEAVEYDETIGWHLEQAHQHLRELGPIDAQGRVLGERAARYLAAAGHRALARDDLPLAASLLGRALDRLDPADEARADLALDWCEALLAAGDVGPAANAIAELGRFIGGSDRLRAWHTCFAGQLAVFTDPQALRATADAVATATDELALAGDAAGEAKAHSVHALALARLGKIGASEAALDRALAAARRGHDRRRANAVLAGAPLAALWGPSPVTRASGRCLDVVRVLRITQGAPAVEAVALRCQGVLEALRGRIDAARLMIASSRRMVEELGITQRLLEADVFAGLIELLEGDAVAAERCLRSAYDGLRSHGLGIDAAQAAALLGRALLAQDRAEEAEALSHESEALAGDDLKAAIAWRGVRAEALARRGEHAAAVELARAAVDIAAATDALLDHADARLALAVALRAAGRQDEADAEEAGAVELWEAKGATLLAERTRRNGWRSAEDRAPERLTRGGEPSAGATAAELATTRARTTPRSDRRLRTNAATANAARLDAAIAARDADVLPAFLAERVEMVHHPTGVVYDRRGALAAWQALLTAEDLSFAHDPLATLGDWLALFRTSVSFSALTDSDTATVGPTNWEEIILIEVDAQGQRTRAEFFAVDRLADAVARLYERYSELLADPAARTRAAAIARCAATLLAPPDLDRYPAAFAPAIEFFDHRSGGLPPGRGIEGMMRGFRVLLDLATDISVAVDDVLRLQPDALLVRFRASGIDRSSGGAYERELLLLWVFGVDGRVRRCEHFNSDGDAAALARFDEILPSPVHGLTAESPATAFANAASRAVDRFQRCWQERDWDGVVATFAATHVMDDRRALMRLHLEGEAYFASLRSVFDAMASSRWDFVLLATRGERLALLQVEIAGASRDSGLLVRELFWVVEADASGRRVALVAFDLTDVDAAYDELERRHAAGEGAPYAKLLASWGAFRRAATARDWEAVRRLLPDDFTMLSHRRLANTGERLGRDGFIASLSWGDDRGVRSEVRRDHLPRLSARAAVEVVTLHGSLDGGAFEQQFILVGTHDGSRLRAFEAFDLDQLDAALARHAELSIAAATPAPIENAATRTAALVDEANRQHDWARFAALFHPGFQNSDRRRMAQLELDRDQYLESMRRLFEITSTTIAVLATRGNRLAMLRVRWQGSDDPVGSSEGEFILVTEVDDRGEYLALVHFDLDSLDAAYAELENRYAAGEAVSSRRATLTRAFSQAFASRDWNTLATLLTADLVVTDHRLLGWETLRGPAAYIHALEQLVDLAPDVRLRIDHVTMSDPRFLYITTWLGTREGGAFESPSAIVCEVDARDKIRRLDQYDLAQLDEARAQVDATEGSSASPSAAHARAASSPLSPVAKEPKGADPLARLARPNAATAAADRVQAAFAERDWSAMRAACRTEAQFEDRRGHALLAGDAAWWVADARAIAAAMPDVRYDRQLVGTAGKRVALERVLWASEPTGGRAEVEYLRLTEVDASGQIAAVIGFDLDDARAAHREARARVIAVDGEAALAVTFKVIEAWNAHDRAAVRRLIADDYVVEDHRRVGIGHIESADAYLDSVAALWELAPDAQLDPLFTIACEPYGAITIDRRHGTFPAGGAFESLIVTLTTVACGRGTQIEFFEIDDAEAALARFEELRPDPLRIPPNAATRVMDRWQERAEARDWEALTDLFAPTFVFEDRRRLVRDSGGRDKLIASVRMAVSSGGRVSGTTLATAGDRLALMHVRFSVFNESTLVSVLENLQLTEVDAEDRIVTVITFDPDDRRTASMEMFLHRYFHGEGARWTPPSQIEFVRAMYDHDLARARAALSDDFFFDDHRRTGVGRIGNADDYIASVAAVYEQSPDMITDTLYHVAVDRHGSLSVGRMFGTLVNGGEFESVFVRLNLYQDGRGVGTELFELEDLDVALARFEELRPTSV